MDVVVVKVMMNETERCRIWEPVRDYWHSKGHRSIAMGRDCQRDFGGVEVREVSALGGIEDIVDGE